MANGDTNTPPRKAKLSRKPTLREAFDVFDKDQDGRITCTELKSVFLMTGATPSDQEIKKMIDEADSDGNGTVEFPEFLRLMNRYNQSRNIKSEDSELLDAFNAFDHNGDNFIDFQELKKTMHILGEQVSDEDVKAMILEADVDHDGRINFEEFKKMMAMVRHH